MFFEAKLIAFTQIALNQISSARFYVLNKNCIWTLKKDANSVYNMFDGIDGIVWVITVSCMPILPCANGAERPPSVSHRGKDLSFNVSKSGKN